MPPHEDPILVVGDIHGCLGALERLLKTACFNPDTHRLWPVGDTINRGLENVGVLKLLKRLGAEPIAGNHELKILAWRRNQVPDSWITRQTVARDLLRDSSADDLFDWIDQWPVFRRGPGFLMVHGGLHPLLPPEATRPSYLANVRICNEKGEMPAGWEGLSNEFPVGYVPWYHHYKKNELVVYGHWARAGLVLTPLTRGIDSGCVYGRVLTGWWSHEDRLVQVEA